MNINNASLTLILEELSKKFESASKTLHNKGYGFWNTVTKSLTTKSVKGTFDRKPYSDQLRVASKLSNTPLLVNTQLPFNLLGALEQDYSRRYLSSRRHAITCAANQSDRVSRDILYIYTGEVNNQTRMDTTLMDTMQQNLLSGLEEN